MADRHHPDAELDDYQPPEWLQERLNAAGASADFLERCRNAALVAYDKRRLRDQQGKQSRPLRISFYDHLVMLAKPIELSLEVFARRLRIPDITHLAPESDQVLKKVGLDIGLSFAEVSLLLRTSLSVEAGHPSLPPPPMFRRTDEKPKTPMEEWEASLTQVEQGYAPALRERLRAIETAPDTPSEDLTKA
jgi:hypothetical protein